MKKTLSPAPKVVASLMAALISFSLATGQDIAGNATVTSTTTVTTVTTTTSAASPEKDSKAESVVTDSTTLPPSTIVLPSQASGEDSPVEFRAADREPAERKNVYENTGSQVKKEDFSAEYEKKEQEASSSSKLDFEKIQVPELPPSQAPYREETKRPQAQDRKDLPKDEPPKPKNEDSSVTITEPPVTTTKITTETVTTKTVTTETRTKESSFSSETGMPAPERVPDVSPVKEEPKKQELPPPPKKEVPAEQPKTVKEEKKTAPVSQPKSEPKTPVKTEQPAQKKEATPSRASSQTQNGQKSSAPSQQRSQPQSVPAQKPAPAPQPAQQPVPAEQKTEQKTEQKEEQKSPKQTSAPVTPSRSVTIKNGQYLDIIYPGSGWIYLGEKDSKSLMKYNGRKVASDAQETSFTLLANQSGTTLLHFYKNDAVTGKNIEDYLEVTVTSERDSGTHAVAPYYEDYVPRNQRGKTPRQEAQAETPAGQVEAKDSIAASSSNGTSIARESSTAQEERRSSSTSQDELLKKAQEEYDAKKYAECLSTLEEFYAIADDSKMDQALYLQGQALEVPSSSRNIKAALQAYQTLTRRYPQSSLWYSANDRITYLRRMYFDIR